MTVLDRAFIKAYADHFGQSPAAAFHKEQAHQPPTIAPEVNQSSPADSNKSSQPRAASPSPAEVPCAASGKTHARLSAAVAPLSSFTAAPKIHEPFRALLEVDQFIWPETCDSLLSRTQESWNSFTEHLTHQISAGKQCVAIASCHRGDGRTTIALAMAKHLAARGFRCVVIDADFENPDLAHACGISAPLGWGDVLRGDMDLGEALISTSEGTIALLPWCGAALPSGQLTASLRMATNFKILRDHFDVVLLDTAALVNDTTVSEFADFAAAIHVDAVYLIENTRLGSHELLASTCASLQRGSIPVEGIIENFVSTSDEIQPAELT